MTFGENLKELRRKSGITQEKLAELMSVSPQAVSRWETDLSKPDISLLPPLANLFSVTTDYLLGMEDYQKNMRKAEYEEAFTDYWKHDDKGHGSLRPLYLTWWVEQNCPMNRRRRTWMNLFLAYGCIRVFRPFVIAGNFRNY